MLLLAVGALLGCEERAQVDWVAEGRAASPSASMAAGSASPGIQAQAACIIARESTALPDEMRETSGLAQSRRDPNLFWTHNDAGNNSELFGIDNEGRIRERVRITGVILEDWEDIEAGPCASGSCLYLADIGDNEGKRESIAVHRIAEPAPGARRSEVLTTLRGRYPEGREAGAQDAEALLVSAGGRVHIVTKGREGAIRLYRFPEGAAGSSAGNGGGRGDGSGGGNRGGTSGIVTLELVRELFPRPGDESERVTAGTVSTDGRWVAVRTYATLYLYPAEAFFSPAAVAPQVVDLRALGQENGEGIALAANGEAWVTSESGGGNSPPLWARLKCELR